MKFENVKVGDEVFIEEKVYVSFGIDYRFFIKTKVEKVTKTRFQVSTGETYNKRGFIIGDKVMIDAAYKLGDKASRVVKDESKEMEAFKHKIAIERSLSRKLGELKIKPASRLSINELEEITELVSNIKKALDRA